MDTHRQTRKTNADGFSATKGKNGWWLGGAVRSPLICIALSLSDTVTSDPRDYAHISLTQHLSIPHPPTRSSNKANTPPLSFNRLRMLIAIKRTFSFDHCSAQRGATIARLFCNKPQHTNNAPLQKSQGIKSSQPIAFVPQFKSSFRPASVPFERPQKGTSEPTHPVYRFSRRPMSDMTLTGSDHNSSTAGRSLQIRLTEQEERICEILDNVAKSYVQKGGKKVELRIAGGWVRDKVFRPYHRSLFLPRWRCKWWAKTLIFLLATLNIAPWTLLPRFGYWRRHYDGL